MIALVLAGVLTISAADAKNHVGKDRRVCGEVSSVVYAEKSRGSPTFANFGRAFTVVVWGDARSRFGAPERAWRGKRICATGKIETYRGRPRITARQKSQIDEEE